jgi:GcrA cell cycle regulator
MEWNEEQVATLTQLWKEGFSAAQVAQQLVGFSRSAVLGKIHRLGVAGREAPSRPRAVSGPSAAAQKATSHGGKRRAKARRRLAGLNDVPFDVPPTATLASLTEHGCRWPIGEPGEIGFGFCGRLRAPRGAYCAGHAQMSFSRRLGAMPAKQIDHLVRRYGDPLTMRAL